ncbi:MAG: hypothetical protein GF331_20975 [Chitinivibrionales bacterium]|nr:hypothetical protein [Chitinivibrionales bacterium]
MAYMSRENKDNDLALRFLQGQLDPKETGEFLERLAHDGALRRALAAESAVEGALMHAGEGPAALTERDMPGNDTDTAHLSHGRNGSFSEGEWRNMVREAITQANAPADPAPVSLAPSRERRLYALAAVLVLALLGLATVATFRYVLPARGDRQAAAMTATTAEHPPLSAEDHLQLASIPQDKKVYTKIADASGFLAEQGSRARLYEKTDSTATVLVASGNLLFGVEENSFTQFTIVTPHSVVTVSGTILRVVVTELESEVTVYDGHADVVHQRRPGLQTRVPPGNTCVADRNSLIASGLSNERLVQKRARLFREYLTFLCTEGESALRKRRS